MPPVPSTPRFSIPDIRSRNPTVLAVLPVLLLHGVLLGLLMQSRPERSAAKFESKPPMAVRFISAAAITPPAPHTPEERTTPLESRIQPARVVSRTLTTEATEATAQLASPDAAITLTPNRTDSAPLAAAPPSPASAPLDLRLPGGAGTRPAVRSPASLATQDSRANSERVNFGEKLAQDLGSDNRRTEENLGDGRVRIRSGSDCVIAVESRAGQLDPVGQTSRPAPRGIKPCK